MPEAPTAGSQYPESPRVLEVYLSRSAVMVDRSFNLMAVWAREPKFKPGSTRPPVSSFWVAAK